VHSERPGRMRRWLSILPAMLLGCAPIALPVEQPPAPATTVALGEPAIRAGVTVTPLRVLEDSRCPHGVQCVQAGTVRLAVRITRGSNSREPVLVLDEPQQVWPGLWVTLAGVCPYPRFPEPRQREGYRFAFMAAEGAPPPPLDFACPRAP